jgi:hypothetical protein
MYSKDKGWPTANCITGHVANTTGNGGVTCKQILNIRYLITEDNIISFTITKKKKKNWWIWCISVFHHLNNIILQVHRDQENV